MRRKSTALCLGLLALGSTLFWLVGCGKSNKVRLTGGGATFPDPIIQKWKDVYYQERNVEIDYSKSGSGQGIDGVTKKQFAFGCSDAPMNKKEVDAAQEIGGEIIHVPVTMEAVAIVYNLPGVEKLILDGPLLAKIFLGDEDSANPDDMKTRKALHWNDKRIKTLNPGVELPDSPINAVGRSEGSGTSNIFTEYLSKVSPEFSKRIGTTKSPKWPGFCSLEAGSDGIARRVKDSPFTIGYVELNYTKNKDKNIPYALLRNHKGHDVSPNAKAVTAAAEAVLKGPKPTKEPYSLHELTYSLTDVDDDAAYPICGISYALLYKKQSADKGKPLVEFLKWATSKGQDYAVDLDYAPLPQEFTKKILALLDQVVFE